MYAQLPNNCRQSDISFANVRYCRSKICINENKTVKHAFENKNVKHAFLEITQKVRSQSNETI